MFFLVPNAVLLLICASLGAAGEGAGATTTTAAPELTLMESARQMIGNLMDSGSSDMKRSILAADISSQCSLGLLKLMRGIRNLEPWAVRLIDSTGKYPTGLLQGSQADLGAYDECLETVVHDQFGNEKIRGQYCSIYIHVVNDTSFTEALIPAMVMSHPRAVHFVDFVNDPKSTLNGINIGLCIIDDCSHDDLQAIANAVTGTRIRVSINNCVTRKPRTLTKIETTILISFGVIGILVVCSTLYDIFMYATGFKNSNQDLQKLLTSFSIVNGTRTFLSISKDKESESHKFRFLHGIRLFSAIWVVVGHSAIAYGNSSARRIDILLFFDDIFGCVVTSAFLSVDTFFFLSGFLLAYNIQQQKRNRFIVAVMGIIQRHIRTTIPMLFVISWFYLVPVIASGPGVIEMMNRFYGEMDSHWYELIFQVRNFGKGLDNTGVFQHLWYISTDFQLFLVALLIFTCFKG
ncbi:nose resistant to fluoxetine protein 6 [Ixodes scapularis]